MKNLVLCACVLIFAFQLSNSTELKQKIRDEVKIKQRIDYDACLSEIGINESDLYSPSEIVANIHTETANEERTRKNGCLMACFLKKQNLMEGTNIKEDEIIARLNEGLVDGAEVKMRKIFRKCMEEKRDITQECAKCFSIYECIIKTVRKEEREREKNVTTEGGETEEPNEKK